MCYHFAVKTLAVSLSISIYVVYSSIYNQETIDIIRHFNAFTVSSMMLALIGVSFSFLFQQRSFEMEFGSSILGAVLFLTTASLFLYEYFALDIKNSTITGAILSYLLAVALIGDAVLDWFDKGYLKEEVKRVSMLSARNSSKAKGRSFGSVLPF